MVGGPDYKRSSFNLATQGQRQPGSAFKAFVLAAALKKGTSPDSVWASQQKEFTVPHSGGKEVFQVHNFEGEYVGSRSLWDAIAQSDNSVFAEVGIRTGIPRIVRAAYAMGIRTPISHNYAITLGGLTQGVTPLDMAHAYETLQQGGLRITNRRLGAEKAGPVGIHEVRDSHNNVIAVNDHPNKIRALPKRIAETETQMLQGVIANGTGTGAAISFGSVLDVKRDGKHIVLHPAHNLYPANNLQAGTFGRYFDGESTSEVGLRWGLLGDTWTAIQPDLSILQKPVAMADAKFGGADTRTQATILNAMAEMYLVRAPAATFRVIFFPFAIWIWLGGGMVLLGALTAFRRPPRGRRERARVKSRVRPELAKVPA